MYNQSIIIILLALVSLFQGHKLSPNLRHEHDDSTTKEQNHRQLLSSNHHPITPLDIGRLDMDCIKEQYGDRVKTIPMKVITKDALINIFDDPQYKNTSFIILETYQNAGEFYSFSQAIDQALAPRHWFHIKKFVISLNKEHTHIIKYIIFERLSELLERSFQPLSQLSYPASQEICNQRPLWIVNVGGDTWGNRAYNLAGMIGSTGMKAVIYFYYTESQSPHNQAPYAIPEECTNLVNKHECLFLPSTNCTIPTSFSHITEYSDQFYENNNNDGKDRGRRRDSIFYSQAGPNGQFLNESNQHAYHSSPEAQKLIAFNIEGSMKNNSRIEYSLKPAYSYFQADESKKYDIKPNGEKNAESVYKSKAPSNDNNISPLITRITSETVSAEIKGFDINPVSLRYIQGYEHRPNTEFRLKIQHYVDRIRSTTSPTFTSNTTCTFVHIRKDDRSLPHIDMLEWCRNHTVRSTINGQFKWVGKRDFFPNGVEGEVSFGSWMNMGCALAIPYGGATLEHFINASLILSPNVKTLFVATDDEQWLHEEIDKYQLQEHQHQNDEESAAAATTTAEGVTDKSTKHNNHHHQHDKHEHLNSNYLKKYGVNIVSFHARHGHRANTSIDVAAEFFATIELGQQCSGYVGYARASAVGRLFYQYMCYYSNGEYLRCPPMFDMGMHI